MNGTSVRDIAPSKRAAAGSAGDVLADLQDRLVGAGIDARLVRASALGAPQLYAVGQAEPAPTQPAAVAAQAAPKQAVVTQAVGSNPGDTQPTTTQPAGAGEGPGRATHVPVGKAWAGLLPGGGLARRAVTQMSACPSVVVDMLAEVTAAGGFAAVVGWPDLVLTGVAERGDVSRLVVIPDGGREPLQAVGLLAEGMDVIVFRAASPVTLSPTRVRPLLSRARAGVAALVFVDCVVPSPAAVVQATVSGVRGVGRGVGRIRALEVSCSVRAKGQPPRQAELLLGQEGLRPDAAPAVDAAPAAGLRVLA